MVDVTPREWLMINGLIHSHLLRLRDEPHVYAPVLRNFEVLFEHWCEQRPECVEELANGSDVEAHGVQPCPQCTSV